LVSRLAEDVTVVRETYTEKLIMTALRMILAFVSSWKVALVAVSVIPFVGISD
jgi:ABC-type multidrug transport system fused ATPase/permease subunit